ncbi:signal peptidase I [Tenacibaculum finnmarkense genomovar ulcerans]|uniref:signal peptidase I n=1 Tax=Tenacibaculum finnmarkense TaxID=2781243 RepID=UPI00187B5DFD|nr:signal peptidase I [Tenacibaculum finnmarkense]MBE7687982.1 signal peptidase I [Tenacibaculum finnmarkense genomovar ulcerans]MCD8399643.1 signal peptidase I [Tenacibaculum finnmarkense genomovar ulcerans]MCG8795280.1 signal peptidase I [Tenacibaculum finnmarkense]MCG8797607.1 signal peptidase I [Tenacibaculum finnmarkense]
MNLIKKYYKESLLLIVILMVTVKLLLIDYFIVSSRSMLPTMTIGSIVFVNKTTNSYKHNDIIVYNNSDTANKTIKRIVGISNDTLKIMNTSVFINDTKAKESPHIMHQYKYFDSSINNYRLKDISNIEISKLTNKNKYKKLINTKALKFYGRNWTMDNLGSLWIPKKNHSIVITDNNFSLYQHIIEDETTLEYASVINKPYTFKNNYYFVMGDFRHHSRDSRGYGLIKETTILGKLLYTLY